MYYNKYGDPITQDAWLQLCADPAYKIVGVAHYGELCVSTVWLGFNHGHNRSSLRIFETMIFHSKVGMRELYCRRYGTLGGAQGGHEVACRWAERRARGILSAVRAQIEEAEK